jgi:hypothetical protein
MDTILTHRYQQFMELTSALTRLCLCALSPTKCQDPPKQRTRDKNRVGNRNDRNKLAMDTILTHRYQQFMELTLALTRLCLCALSPTKCQDPPKQRTRDKNRVGNQNDRNKLAIYTILTHCYQQFMELTSALTQLCLCALSPTKCQDPPKQRTSRGKSPTKVGCLK